MCTNLDECQSMNLENEASALMEEKKFRKASNVLTSLKKSYGIHHLNVVLDASECFVMCGKIEEIVKAQEELFYLIKALDLTFDEVTKIGNERRDAVKYVQSALLFISAAKLAKETMRGSEAIGAIDRSVGNVMGIATLLLQSGLRFIVTKFLMPSLQSFTIESLNMDGFTDYTYQLKFSEGYKGLVWVMLDIIQDTMLKGKHRKACKILNQLTESLHAQQYTPKNVAKLGNEHSDEGDYFKAYLLHFVAAKLVDNELNGEGSVEIYELLIDNISVEDLAQNHIIRDMHEIVNHLKRTVVKKQKVRTKAQAHCLLRIAQCHFDCANYDEGISVLEQAHCVLQSELGNKADKCKLTGYVLHDAGVGYQELGKIDKAVGKFDAAVTAYKKAKDWSSCDERKRAMHLLEKHVKGLAAHDSNSGA